MAEQLSACYARIYALRVSVLRLFSIYGPGLRKQLLWDACNKLTRGTLSFAGTGAEMRDWLHVSDAVALVAKVLQDAAAEPYRLLNGGTGAGASVSQVLQELAAALDVRGRVVFTGGARAGNPASLIADNARARALGWRPTYDWRTGVRQYAEWFRSMA
jgi:UDP-glucose 4-epimerase